MNTRWPRPALEHPRQQRVREHDRRAQVDVERAVDLLHRERLEPARRRNPGVGDQDVHLAGLRGQPRDLRGSAERSAGERARVQLRGERLEHDRPRATGERSAAAPRAASAAGDRLADAARGAGEQHAVSRRSAQRCEPRRDARSSRCSGRPASARPPSRSRSPQLLRARGEDPVAVSADALQVYAGLETLTGAASPAEQALLEHRLRVVPAARRDLQRRPVRAARARRDRRAARRRAPPDRRRRHRPVPARRAGRARPAPAAAGGRARALAGRARAQRARGRCTPCSRERAPWAAAEIDPNDRQRIVRALELLDLGELEPPEGPSQLWSAELRHPTLLVGPDDGARRRCTRAIDERVERDGRRGRPRGGAARAHARRRLARRRARRSASRSCSQATSSAMKRRTRNYAKRQLTWMRKLAGVRADRRRRGVAESRPPTWRAATIRRLPRRPP